jgi:glycosyltransferase involved in cell wall biosynthesis
MLCSNDGKTAVSSIESLIPLFGELNLEIVVVDNMSTDGSWEALKAISAPNLKLLRERSSRGRARQIGFEGSSGDYVLAHLDCDDTFDPKGIMTVLRRYHSDYEGKMLATMQRGWSSNITIAPRSLIQEIGGWRDVNWYEDWDLWVRTAAVGQYRFMPYPQENAPHSHITVRFDRRSIRSRRVRARYEQYRDSLRLGKAIFRKGERVLWNQWAIYYLARVDVAIRSPKLEPVPDPLFEPLTG